MHLNNSNYGTERKDVADWQDKDRAYRRLPLYDGGCGMERTAEMQRVGGEIEAVLGIRIQCHVRHPLRRYGRHTVRHPSMYSSSTLGRPPRKREVTYNGRRRPSNESRKRAACDNSKNDVIWQISTVASL